MTHFTGSRHAGLLFTVPADGDAPEFYVLDSRGDGSGSLRDGYDFKQPRILIAAGIDTDSASALVNSSVHAPTPAQFDRLCEEWQKYRSGAR